MIIYSRKKIKREKKEVSRYPLKRITNRVEKCTRKQLCHHHDIPYDENSIPTIQKINLLLGSSYDLRDECKKYMKTCNDTAQNYKEHLCTVENLFKLKIEQFKKFHETLGECLTSIN